MPESTEAEVAVAEETLVEMSVAPMAAVPATLHGKTQEMGEALSCIFYSTLKHPCSTRSVVQ